MKRLILLFIPALFLLTACAQPRYVWQHDTGLGEAELQQDRKVCYLYSEQQTPPIQYFDYPYSRGWHPFYYSGYRYPHRQHRYSYNHRSYYRQGYFSDFNVYAYQEDISRACLKGKGWNRIRIDEG